MSVASQLSKQLAKLQTRPVNDDKLAKSFLFSNTDAKDLSREQIHELGVAGMRTLLSIDNRFTDILQVLFNPDRVRRERSMYTTEENKEINAAIETLCTLMGPHLFVTATHQVLEYLIRVYEVHTQNVTTLLRMFLPYHDHAIFARLLMVLDLRGSGFDYLEKNQLNGAPLPRSSLVTTAAENAKVLRLICNAAADALTLGVANNAAFALFAGVACKLATSAHSDAVLRTLLPYLVRFLSCEDSANDASDEVTRKKAQKGEVFDAMGNTIDGDRPRASIVWGMAVSSGMIVVHTWCNASSLTARVLSVLLRPIVSALVSGGNVTLASGVAISYPVTIPEIVRFIGHVVRSQSSAMADALLTPVLTELITLPWGNWLSSGLVSQNVATSNGGVHQGVFALLRRLLDFSLLQLKQFLPVATASSPYVQFMAAACNQMRGLGQEDVRVIFDSILAYCCQPASGALAIDSTLGPVLVSSLKSLERMYPLHFDKAVANAINPTSQKQGKNASASPDAESVIKFISVHFVGTKFELLDISRVTKGATGQSIPLLSCLLHHIPGVRQLALTALTGQLKKGSASLFAVEITGDKVSTNKESDVAVESTLLPLLNSAIASETSPVVAAQCIALVEAVLNLYLSAVSSKKSSTLATTSTALASLMSASWRMVSASLEENLISAESTSNALALGKLCSKSVSTLRPHTVAYNVYSEALFILTTLALTEGASGEATTSFMDLLAAVCDVAAPETASATPSSSKKAEASSSDSDDDVPTKSPSTKTKKTSPFANEKVLCGSAVTDIFKALTSEGVDGTEIVARLIGEYEASVRLMGTKFDKNTTVGLNRSLSQHSELATLVAILTRCAVVDTPKVASTSIAMQAMKLLEAMVVRATSLDSAASTVDMIHIVIALVLEGAVHDASIHRENFSELVMYLLFTQHIAAEFLSTCPPSILWKLISPDTGCVTCSAGSIALFKKYLTYLKRTGGSSPLIKSSETVDVDEDCSEFLFHSLIAALYRNPALSANMFAKAASSEIRAAALLVLMVPVLAPNPQLRQKAAESLQTAFLKAGGGGPAAKGGLIKKKDKKLQGGAGGENPTPLYLLVEALKSGSSSLYPTALSVTSLSSLVETLALVSSTRTPAPMTEDAVKFVAELAFHVCDATTASGGGDSKATTVSLAVIARVIKQVFVSVSGGSGKGAEVVLSQFKSHIEMCLSAADGALTHDEVTLLSALISTSLPLSYAFKAPATFPTVCWAVGALLKKGTIVYTATGSSNALIPTTTTRRRHPVYLSVLRAFAAMPMNSASKSLNENAGSLGSIDSIVREIFTPLYSKGASSASWLQTGSVEVAAETSEMERISSRAAIVSFLSETHVGHDLFFSKVVPRIIEQLSAESAADSTATPSKAQKRSRSDDAASATVSAKAGPTDATLLEMTTDVIRFMINAGTSEESEDTTIFGKLQIRQTLGPQTVKALFDAASRLIKSTVHDGAVVAGSEQLHVDALRLLRMLVVAATQMPHDHVSLPKSHAAEAPDSNTVSILAYIAANTNVSSLAPCFLPVLASTSSEEPVSNYRTTSGVVVSASARAVLQIAAVDFLQAIVAAVVENSIALGGPKGVIQARHALLSHSLVLLGNILTFEGPSGSSGAIPSHLGRVIHIISPILRIDRKDVGGKAPTASKKSSPNDIVALESPDEDNNSSFIHLPVAALFLRLILQWEETAVSRTNESTGAWISDEPVDVILSIVGQLAITEQISCIRGLMLLVSNPKKHLEAVTGADEGKKAPVHADAMRALCTKLLKPSRIANRQEPFLNLIVRLIKSDAFLSLFIEMQHQGVRHTKESIRDAVNNQKKVDAEEEDDEENVAAAEGAELTTSAKSDECAGLLVAALEMFSTFHDGNINTPPSLETDVEAHEAKSYAMLLELLSSNALACVLAAINEPTFVSCQLRLLADPRDGLRRKGISSLVDRLHQSLPLDEFELTAEEVERRRKDMRDPKKKLAPTDLIELRARPLTTRRSSALLPVLLNLVSTEMGNCGLSKAVRTASEGSKKKFAVAAAPTFNRDGSSQDLQLVVATVEELVRILGGGGSIKAEMALTSTQYAAGMATPVNSAKTDIEIYQYFGNKMRFEEVNRFMSLALCALDEIAATATYTADQLVIGSTFLIAASTVLRTLGAWFAVRHSEQYLQALSKWMSVVRVCCNVSGCADSKQRRVFDPSEPVIALLRSTLLAALKFNLPLMWIGASVHVPAFLAFISLNCNCNDSNTVEIVAELLLQFRALLGPRAIFECLCGALSSHAKTTDASNRNADATISPFTHDIRLIFTFIASMLKDLTKEDLEGIPVLVLGDTAFTTTNYQLTGPKKNFWTAALSALTSASGNTTTAIVASVEVMEPVFEAYATFFMKFREKKCAKLLSTLIQWTFGSALSGEDENGGGAEGVDGFTKTQLTKHYVFFSLYAHLLRNMRDVLVFSFPQLVSPIVEILAKYNATPFTLLSETGGEAAGAWIIQRRRMLAGRVLTSLKAVLEVVKIMSEVTTPADADEMALLEDGTTFFARNEVFVAMMPLLIAHLSNLVVFEQGESDNTVEDENTAADNEDGDSQVITGDADRFGAGGAMLTDLTFNSTVQRTLIPAIRRYFISLQSPKLWSSTQKEILRLLRHPKYTVRKSTLLLLNGIYKDGGDQLCATIMAEGLPAIVEMTEDTNRAVVEQARQLCNELSSISGQDVLFAMS